jgi:hypothetical protein
MDQRQFEVTLADAEIRLRRLRTLYDQWFHGLERTEPRTQRSDIDRIVTELRRSQPRNTALRFRFNQLVQRYTTYNTYWQRITRQIEEGTYKRDVLRARRRAAGGTTEPGQRAPGDDRDLDLELDIDVEAALEAVRQSEPPTAAGSTRSSSRPPPPSDRPLRTLREITPFALPSAAPPKLSAPPAVTSRLASSPAAVRVSAPPLQAPPALGPKLSSMPPLPAASRKPPPLPANLSRKPPPLAATESKHPPPSAPKPGPASGVSDDQIQNIYQRYLDARRQNRERTDNVKLETVAKTVRDMLPKLTQKHGGKRIDFEVVVKDGRVALKPVAK